MLDEEAFDVNEILSFIDDTSDSNDTLREAVRLLGWLSKLLEGNSECLACERKLRNTTVGYIDSTHHPCQVR